MSKLKPRKAACMTLNASTSLTLALNAATKLQTHQLLMRRGALGGIPEEGDESDEGVYAGGDPYQLLVG